MFNLNRTWDEKQQQKNASATSGGGPGSPRGALSAAESAQLLALLDDVNTLVKHVRILFTIAININKL